MKHLKKINEDVDNKELTIVSGEDWEGVYYNNQLIDQGHSINWRNVLEHFGYTIKSKSIDSEEQWEILGWNLPNNLSELESKLNSKKYNL